ncbi:MAG: glycosyltransferase [Dysgonamonadaceae bacterium]|nr:glycosyltransferase [Dysgonamonadaceae bacterium]
MYKKAFADRNFLPTVTSVEYGEALNKRLKINKHYALIHDVFYDSYKSAFEIKKCTEQTVFCGGRNGRDWDEMIQVAKKMPDVNFNFVMPEKKYKQFTGNFTANINVLSEIPKTEFDDLMRQSCLVCLPLDTDAPAGLIVLFQAAAYRKLVITSSTQTTREYINEQRGVLLEKNVQDYINAINYYLNNPKIAQEKADNLFAFLEKYCSEEEFIKGIVSLIHTIQ